MRTGPVVHALQSVARDELRKYVKALEESFTERLISLAEGELAAYSKMAILDEAEAEGWQQRILGTRPRKGR